MHHIKQVSNTYVKQGAKRRHQPATQHVCKNTVKLKVCLIQTHLEGVIEAQPVANPAGKQVQQQQAAAVSAAMCV